MEAIERQLPYDVNQFWMSSSSSSIDIHYLHAEYENPTLTSEMITSIEASVGYKLPAFYIRLCSIQNGGLPNRREYRLENVPYKFSLRGIFGIGYAEGGIAGEWGTKYLVESFDYPDIGIYFADSHTAGQDMFCFDYRDVSDAESQGQEDDVESLFDSKEQQDPANTFNKGKGTSKYTVFDSSNGLKSSTRRLHQEKEPRVSHVEKKVNDQTGEDEFEITVLANSFEEFVRNLKTIEEVNQHDELFKEWHQSNGGSGSNNNFCCIS